MNKFSYTGLPITVIVAAKNEDTNIVRCIEALAPAEKVIVVDSHSTDKTAELAGECGAEVVQFDYAEGYPKKRQWTLDNISISSAWIMLIDADEVVPEQLWKEIALGLAGDNVAAYMALKGFHFMGRRFRFGGFSHSAVVLFRKGSARFEHVLEEASDALDMEVHERLIVDGKVGRLDTPLIHEDFKGMDAYIERHKKYATWEAMVRYRFLKTGQWGEDAVQARLFGSLQERRRFLKSVVTRLPFEHVLWFVYHYVVRLGFLEGRSGLIACRIRSAYIAQVRDEIRLMRDAGNEIHKK